MTARRHTDDLEANVLWKYDICSTDISSLDVDFPDDPVPHRAVGTDPANQQRNTAGRAAAISSVIYAAATSLGQLPLSPAQDLDIPASVIRSLPHSLSRTRYTGGQSEAPSTKVWEYLVIDVDVLDQVEKLFELRRPLEVRTFLSQNPALLPLLIEMLPQVERHFGTSTAVVLEIVHDPELPDSEQLVAYIQGNRPIKEGLRCLDALDQAWWLVASGSADGKLCLHLE